MVTDELDEHRRGAWLRRWLTATALLHTAEGMSGRGTSVSASVALIAAATSSETALAAVALLEGPPTSQFNVFKDLIGRAASNATRMGAPIPPDLLFAVQNAQDVRNKVIHGGTTASDRDADDAVRSARRLLNHLPLVVASTPEVEAREGLAAAVASLLPTGRVSYWLREAEVALDRDEVGASASAAAQALDLAFVFCSPGLPQFAREPWRRRVVDRRAAEDNTVLLGELSEIRGVAAQLEPWVVSYALGLGPARYIWLRATIGRTTIIPYSRGPLPVSRAGEPTREDTERAVTLVAEIIFGLWERGILQLNLEAEPELP